MDAHTHDMLVRRMRALSRELAPIAAGVEPRLAPLAGVRAVLFDVYGTLLISGSGDVGTATATDSDTALLEALNATGFTTKQGANPEADLLKQMIEQDHAEKRTRGTECPEVEIRSIWGKVLPLLEVYTVAGNKASPEQIEQLAMEYECRVNPTWPMPGAGTVIRALRERDLLLGIVSNAQFYTPFLLEAHLGDTPAALGFPPELCSWSFAIREAKPSLRMFEGPLRVLRDVHGVTPAEVVYVGNDCLKDMWTARQAGCQGVLFAGDARSLRLRQDDERCQDLAPDAIITRLDQLPGLLA